MTRRNAAGKKLGAASHVPHIPLMADAGTSKACPICGKPADALRTPFCSKRCADIDLHRWFSGVYAAPVTEDEEEDERRDDSGEEPN